MSIHSDFNMKECAIADKETDPLNSLQTERFKAKSLTDHRDCYALHIGTHIHTQAHVYPASHF